MKRVLIIAAPFGFGPASKALTIAEYLRGSHQAAFFTSGSSVEFIRACTPPQTTVHAGVFRDRFPSRASLDAFDCFIAVNQLPAVMHLDKLGLAGRTILVDSLAQWRAESSPADLPKDLLAYIIQDELGSKPVSPTAIDTVVTAPILWPDDEILPLSLRQNVLLHVGGMTSPVAKIDPINRIVSGLIAPLIDFISETNPKVTVLGNADVLRDARFASEINLLANVSPKTAIREIGSAKLLITTPGIGAIYEAMSKGTPTILLPPMNSTQFRHYRVLTEMGVPGVLAPSQFEKIAQKIGAAPWPQQTPFLLRLFSDNSAILLKMSRQTIESLTGTGNGSRHEAMANKMAALWAALSRVPARNAIADALDRIV